MYKCLDRAGCEVRPIFFIFTIRSKNLKTMQLKDTTRGLEERAINSTAYGKHVIYRVEFRDKDTEYYADILTRNPLWYGYGRILGGKQKRPDPQNPNCPIAFFYNAGEIVRGGFSPLIISRSREDQTDPMYSSTATLTLWSETDGKFRHLAQETDAVMLYVWTKPKDAQLFRLIFSGVLDTSQYTEPYYKKDRYFVELTFQEYGQLKRIRHRLIQGQTVQEHIQTLLSQRFDCCSYRQDLPDEEVPINIGANGIRPDISVFKDNDGKNAYAYDVLSMMLKNFGMELIQTNNVLNRVALSQISVKKGEELKGEPILKEVSHDNTLTITEPAKEVRVGINIKDTERREDKTIEFPKGYWGRPNWVIYRHDVNPDFFIEMGGEKVPKPYPAYKIGFHDIGGGFYSGKVQKLTEGEDEEFISLFFNEGQVVPLRKMYGGNYEKIRDPKSNGHDYGITHFLPKNRLSLDDPNKGWVKAPHRYEETERVIYNIIEEEGKFSTVSPGLVLTDPITIPPDAINPEGELTWYDDPDYLLTLRLKLKVDLFTNMYHTLRDLEVRKGGGRHGEWGTEPNVVPIEKINGLMDKIWKNGGAYLYGAVLALDDNNNIVAYLKSEGVTIKETEELDPFDPDIFPEGDPGATHIVKTEERNDRVKYSWQYTPTPSPLSTYKTSYLVEPDGKYYGGAEAEEGGEIKAGALIPNNYIKDYICAFPFGGRNGLSYNNWQSISTPAYTPDNDNAEHKELISIFEDEGLHIPEMPKKGLAKADPVKIVFICCRKLVIALREANTYDFKTGVVNIWLYNRPEDKLPGRYETKDKKAPDGMEHVRQYLGINMSYTDLHESNGGVYSERDHKNGEYPFFVDHAKEITDNTPGAGTRTRYKPYGADEREVLSPYHIFVKDPEIVIKDLKTELNKGKDYKESKTIIKNTLIKSNSDYIKEELMYDIKGDIPKSSPNRIFLEENESITPRLAQCATFSDFTFSDLRGYEILTKKKAGLVNLEGTFRYSPESHNGVFYHRGKKFISSREEIDLKTGHNKMTLHEVAIDEMKIIEREEDDTSDEDYHIS